MMTVCIYLVCVIGNRCKVTVDSISFITGSDEIHANFYYRYTFRTNVEEGSAVGTVMAGKQYPRELKVVEFNLLLLLERHV